MVLVNKLFDSASWWFLIAGIALGVGFIWPLYWWLVFPGVASFLVAVSRAETRTSVFWGGWLAGTIKMLFSIGWFWTTYPIRWIDLSLGWFELPVIGFYWLTVAISIGVSFGVFGLLLHLLRRYWRRTWLVAACLLWVPAEVFGAWCFSLLTYGDGGQLHTLFSFGMAGYHLAEHPWLLQIARLGGVYTLSFTAVVGGVLLYVWRIEFMRVIGRRCLVAVAVVVIGSSFLTTEQVTERSGQSVTIVDTTFGGVDFFSLPSDEREKERLTTLSEALSVALATNAPYVVMPEDSRVSHATHGPRTSFKYWQSLVGEVDSLVIDAGRVLIGPQTAALRATIYDPRGAVGHVVDKKFLVPQGEYMPLFYHSLLQVIGLGEIASAVSARLAYRPGPYQSQAAFPRHVPGILFCFEDADPLAVRRLVRERPVPFVAHPISHAWFSYPESLWQQFDAMLKTQAVWNQTPIVSAGNMVAGALYTPRGEKIVPTVVGVGDRFTVRMVSW